MIISFLSRLFRRSRSKLAVDQRRSLSSLTPREKQIAQLWTHSNKQISRQLYITPETVRSHWKNIYAKLGVHSKEEVGRILDHGQKNSSQS